MDEKLIYKKNLLIRKNKSKLYLDNYRHNILELFKISPDEIYLLTLEESDAIRKHNFNNSGIVNIRYENAEIDIRKSILNICENNTEPWYVFIDDDWQYCGCFQIDNLHCINNDFKFGKMISDDIVFINKNFSMKVIYDCFEMDNRYLIDCEVLKI